MFSTLQDAGAAAEKAAENQDSGSPDLDSLYQKAQAWVADPALLKDDLFSFGIEWVPKLLGAIVFFWVGRWAARKIRRGLSSTLEVSNDATLAKFLSSLVYMALMVFVVVGTLSILNVKSMNFAAILASAGFAIGMALQGSLGNFAAGVMILVFKPFKAGDVIEAAGHIGKVNEVGIFATILQTGDNKRVIVPNGELTASSLTNYSANGTRRVDMTFGIGYGDSIDEARDILQGILDNDERVLSEPKALVAVAELADSSVNFVCRPWVNSADYWDVLFETTEAVKKTFDTHGISIPFPQQEVHLHQIAEKVSAA